MTRVTSKRIETTDLQGEGSYIVVKSLSWKTSKQVNRFLTMGDVAIREDMTPAEKEKLVLEETALTEECVFTSLVEWNWTDENGAPLTLPRKTEDLDVLTSEEVYFLIKACSGQGTDSKNSKTGSQTTSGSEEQTTLPQMNG